MQARPQSVIHAIGGGGDSAQDDNVHYNGVRVMLTDAIDYDDATVHRHPVRVRVQG